jgi:hypothetical protein
MAPKAYYTQERRAFLSFPDRIASSSAILFLLLTLHLLTLLFQVVSRFLIPPQH